MRKEARVDRVHLDDVKYLWGKILRGGRRDENRDGAMKGWQIARGIRR